MVCRQPIGRQVLFVALSALALTACQGGGGGGSSSTASAPATVTPLASLGNGAAGTATRGAGFETATLNSALTASTNDVVTGNNATLTFFTNGSLGLTAPNIPTNGRTDSVTFSSFTGSTSPLAGAGVTSAVAVSANGVAVQMNRFGASLGLQYTEFGNWMAPACGSCSPTSIGVFATGNPTPTSQMPTTGSAAYAGSAQGVASTGTVAGMFSGQMAMTANFATSALTGSITNIRTAAINGTTVSGTMNDITLSGGIGANGFNGTATAGTTAGSAISITGATGTFGGSFYGTSAAEIGGSFKLTSGATTQVIGSFGAHK